MLLVCPSCSSAFRIPPAAITVAGRAVRCSHCQHVWTAVPDDLVPEPDFETAEAGAPVGGLSAVGAVAAPPGNPARAPNLRPPSLPRSIPAFGSTWRTTLSPSTGRSAPRRR
ncbi:MAG: hypothetical protein HC900_08110 [Methylacidiphilales bacterium]|nr:hypothetical protein [Candidatus Methylacidiphilales bacterium]